MATSELHNFHIADYVVFGAMLLISIGIGIFHACVGGKQKSTKEFLMANQSMGFLPIALSVLAGFFSASTLLGTPAEIYIYGTQYWMFVFGAMCAPITGALLFGPLFFKLKVVSVFQNYEDTATITEVYLQNKQISLGSLYELVNDFLDLKQRRSVKTYEQTQKPIVSYEDIQNLVNSYENEQKPEDTYEDLIYDQVYSYDEK